MVAQVSLNGDQSRFTGRRPSYECSAEGKAAEILIFVQFRQAATTKGWLQYGVEDDDTDADAPELLYVSLV